jgi:hypothetical protein
LIEGVLRLRAHRSRRRRAEVDADDHRVCGGGPRTRQAVFAAGDIGAIATWVASRFRETQHDRIDCVLRRLIDDREDEDATSRQVREGRIRRIRRRPIAVADALRCPRDRLLGRRDAAQRPVRRVERPARSATPARKRPKARRLRPRSKGNRCNELKQHCSCLPNSVRVHSRTPGASSSRPCAISSHPSCAMHRAPRRGRAAAGPS